MASSFFSLALVRFLALLLSRALSLSLLCSRCGKEAEARVRGAALCLSRCVLRGSKKLRKWRETREEREEERENEQRQWRVGKQEKQPTSTRPTLTKNSTAKKKQRGDCLSCLSL